jgi:hypothetical protein
MQNIGVGVHWQGAGVECHLDTLSVTWVVMLTLGVVIRYRPAEYRQQLDGCYRPLVVTGVATSEW